MFRPQLAEEDRKARMARADGGKTMAPVAVYLRISRADEDDRRGVERQRKDCLRLVKARGWTVKDGLMFIDNDVSAYSRKARPEWVRMLTAIEAGEGSV